jgi:two-component system response regulator AtoC
LLPALGSDGVALVQLLAAIERHYIEEAMRQASGNKNRAAILLGLNRTTLVEKLKRLGL